MLGAQEPQLIVVLKPILPFFFAPLVLYVTFFFFFFFFAKQVRVVYVTSFCRLILLCCQIQFMQSGYWLVIITRDGSE